MADTIRHQLRLVSPTGKDLKSIDVRYPNGLSRFKTDSGDVLVVAETGFSRPVGFSAQLEKLSLVPVNRLSLALQALRDPARNHELLDLTTGADGSLAVAYCRNTRNDCTFYAFDSAGVARDLGDLDGMHHPHPELVENDNMSGEIALTTRGTLLVASPRMTQIYELGDGPTRPFGGPELAAQLDELRAVRPRWAGVEDIGRWGALLMSALMVGLFVVARQTGVFSPERAQQRLDALWKRVIRPDLGAYVALGASALGAAVAFGLLGWTRGPGLGVAAALGGAMLGVRLLGVFRFELIAAI